MLPYSLRGGLCALAALTSAAVASAQTPLVVRTPGSTTVITNSGNGVGNRVVVSGTGGTTIVSNVRNGIGNRLILDPDELLIDLDELCPLPKCKPAPKPPSYVGKNNPFWTRKQFSDEHDCNLYWGDADRLWFRYHPDDDVYRPLKVQPAAPAIDPPALPPPAVLPDR